MNYARLMKPYKREMITSLVRLVNIDSVYDPKTVTKGRPYGKGVEKALRYVGDLGERFGFDVDYCDGRCTELSFGEGKTLIGIYAHADVVPVSGNWKHPPFSGKIERKRIYGRGTSDDKGPLIAAFFALKALKDNGLIKGYRVKLVVGGDEERGSSGLDYYFNVLKKEEPSYGFTPDSDFPVIYAEKGRTLFRASLPVDLGAVQKIEGGAAPNAVCSKCVLTLAKDVRFVAYLEANGYHYEYEDLGKIFKVSFLGKSAHGSTPAKGVNAAIIALKAIGEFYKVDALKNIASKLADPSGKLFGGYHKSKVLKATTYNLGMIRYEKKELAFSIDFRYGEDVKPDDYVNNFAQAFGAKTEVLARDPHLLYSPKSKFIRTLLKAYRAETGDWSRPLAIGGGTYAKHVRNTVAFGGMFPYSVNVMHAEDEFYHLDDLKLAAIIYAHAVALLGKLDAD